MQPQIARSLIVALWRAQALESDAAFMPRGMLVRGINEDLVVSDLCACVNGRVGVCQALMTGPQFLLVPGAGARLSGMCFVFGYWQGSRTRVGGV